MAKRILIIDDEKDMHVYLRTLFRKAGYETEVAATAADGLAKALAWRPHLVTLDLLMPRRSGIEVYQAIRSAPETHDTPVVVLTGLASHEGLLRDLDALPRPQAIVEKPIDRERFLGLVKSLIGEPA